MMPASAEPETTELVTAHLIVRGWVAQLRDLARPVLVFAASVSISYACVSLNWGGKCNEKRQGSQLKL